MTAVHDLAVLVGEPATPPARTPWERSCVEIGTDLPSDYRELIDRFGRFELRGELNVWAPSIKPRWTGGPTGFAGFVEYSLTDMGDLLVELNEFRAADDQYAMFPEPGGLLTWGGNKNGDRCFWLTRGRPDEWPVVLWYRHGDEWATIDGGIAQFLLDVATGRSLEADDIAPVWEGKPLLYRTGDWLS